MTNATIGHSLSVIFWIHIINLFIKMSEALSLSLSCITLSQNRNEVEGKITVKLQQSTI